MSDGVTQGINVVSAHTQRHADLLELRVCVLFVQAPSTVLDRDFFYNVMKTG